MKRDRIVLSLLAVCLATNLCQGGELALLTRGKSDYRIMVPNNYSDYSSDVVFYAAEEFQSLFQQMTDTRR